MTKTPLTPLLLAMPPQAIETTRIQSVAGITGRRIALTVDSLPTAHILLLVNYRPEYQHRWSSKTS